jgi:lipopolysaccharide/colanic/teichoic acid biosynthesis glycosyltransferase
MTQLDVRTVGRTERTPQPTVGARRRRLMLAWAASGIAAAIAAIALADALMTPTESERIFIDTLWWCVGAFVATALLIDRSIHAPTAEGGLWVAFSSALCFTALLVLFGATHSAYSRAALGGSYAIVTVWLLFGVRRHMRRQVLRLGVPEASVLQMLEAAMAALHGVRLTHVEAELIHSTAIDDLQSVDGVVIDRYNAKSPALQRLITQMKLDGVRIYSADHIHELLTGRVALDHTEDSFLDDSSGRVIYGIVKRLLDIVSAIVLLAVFAIPMAIVAAAIRVGGDGSALFRQDRVGRGGRVFRMIKFRTMRGTETGVDHSPDSARSAVADADVRVTPLGRLLRKYRLDELPQLFNVLGGTMSLIGPRPEWVATAAEFFDRIPHYPYRHLVRPGITGWAQVSQGHVTALPDAMIKLELDLYYVKHLSFALDLVIGVRTLRTIVTGHGAR